MPVVTRIGKLIVEIRESSKTAITQLSYVMFLVSHLLNYAKISKNLISTTWDWPHTSLKTWQHIVMKDCLLLCFAYRIVNQQITQCDCKVNIFACNTIHD